MADVPQIKVGQTWESRDKREAGLLARVVAVEADTGVVEPWDNPFVTIERFRRSRLRAHTLRTRYQLVKEAPRA